MVATVKGLKNAAQAAWYFGHDPRQAPPSRADYYTEGREGPSFWAGALASELGLSGEVDRKDLYKIMAGHVGGEDLNTHGNKRSPGIDVCLQAPKSVTYAALYLGDERVLAAHRAAVAEALTVIEREAAARLTQDGVTLSVSTGKLLIAAAEHCTVRESEAATKGAGLALDGHLHTHCVFLNVTRLPDGRYVALDGRFAFQQQLRFGALYHSGLAERLHAIGWTPVFRADGTFDLAEIPQSVIDQHSRRRAEILGEAGEGASAKQRDAANQKTRKAKDKELDLGELRQQWLEEGGIAMPEFQLPQGDGVLRSPEERNRAGIQFARDHLFERSAAVSFDEFERVALAAGADGPSIRQAIAEHADLIHGAEIDIRDKRGRVRTVPAVVSRDALQRERSIIATARRGRGAVEPIDANVAAVAARMAAPDGEGRKLNPEQQTVATALLTTDSRFLAIQGVAGAGKTFTMRRAFDEARGAGYSILGLAPTNKAAGELRAATGEGQTLASFLASDSELDARSIVVLDEAGMVGSSDMLALIERIEQAGARLVVVGDTEQLKSVSAGDPFGLLQRAGCLHVVTLTQSTRAKTDEMKAVYADLFRGSPREALARLDPMVIEDSAARHAAIADRYVQSDDEVRDAEGLTARDRTLILVGTNAARVAINHNVRERLGLTDDIRLDTLRAVDATEAQLRRIDTYRAGQIVQAGDLIIDPQTIKLHAKRGEQFAVAAVDYAASSVTLQHLRDPARTFTVTVGANMPRLQIFERETLPLTVGDRVLMRENDKKSDVFNGDRGRVVAIDPDRHAVTIQVGTGKDAKTITLNDRERLPQLQHGYAMTVHSAQGATVDHVLSDLSADRTTNRNLLLVAATRARLNCEVWTSDLTATRQAVNDAAIKFNAREVLAERLQSVIEHGSRTHVEEQENKMIEKNVGVIVRHGEAPYRNDPKARASYFVTLKGDDGRERTFWGLDLRRVLEEQDGQAFKIGDRVRLTNRAQEAENTMGRAKRNVWEAEVLPSDAPQVQAVQRQTGLAGEYRDPHASVAGDGAFAGYYRQMALVDNKPVTEYVRHADQKTAFVDEGDQINASDTPTDDDVRAMIALAQEKWGPEVQVTGTDEWKRQVARVCAADGIEFGDKEMQALIEEARAEQRAQEQEQPTEPAQPQRTMEQPQQDDAAPAPTPRGMAWLDDSCSAYMSREGSVFARDELGDFQFDQEATAELRSRQPDRYRDLVIAAGGQFDAAGKPCTWHDGQPVESRQAREVREYLEAEIRTADLARQAPALAAVDKDGQTVALHVADGRAALVERAPDGTPTRAIELRPEEANQLREQAQAEGEISGARLREISAEAAKDWPEDRPRATLDRGALAQHEVQRDRVRDLLREPAPEQGASRDEAEAKPTDRPQLGEVLDRLADEQQQQERHREMERSHGLSR